jgi:hypothetical protein
MESLIWIPVDNTSLETVEKMLHGRDVFTSGFENLDFNPYEATAYLRESYAHGTEVVFRYDRNILSRLMELVRGENPTDEHRIACGIQVLAQVSKAEIEPNIGLYELGSGTSASDAQREIAVFRRIDNTHPQILANLATGLSNSIDQADLGQAAVGPETMANFEAVLDRWRACYSACLKIAALELAQLGAEEKMLELLRWFEEDLCFLAPAIILANRYLAPNAPRKGLFKGLRSENRDRALAGIRNAAWDLTFIYAWMDDLRTMHSSGRIVIMASLDKALHSIARNMMAVGEDDDHAEVSQAQLLEEEYLTSWGPVRGRRVLDAYLATQARRVTHTEKRRELTLEYTKDVERELEEEIRRFKP